MSIKKLRRVVDLVDVFEDRDHNDHVDNWVAQLSIDKQLSQLVEDPDLQSLISRLETLVNAMRRIKPGDFYYADDHNKFVDAWEIQVQINSMLSELCAPPPPCIPTILLEEEVSMLEEFVGPLWLEEDVSALRSEAVVTEVTEEGKVAMGEGVTVEQQ